MYLTVLRIFFKKICILDQITMKDNDKEDLSYRVVLLYVNYYSKSFSIPYLLFMSAEFD